MKNLFRVCLIVIATSMMGGFAVAEDFSNVSDDSASMAQCNAEPTYSTEVTESRLGFGVDGIVAAPTQSEEKLFGERYAVCYWACVAGGGGWMACGDSCSDRYLR